MDLTAKPFLTGLLLLVLFFLRLDVSAQDPTPLFKNYSTENGLPSSEVYCCLQDNDRNLWFGTDRGVVRFNGYEFKTFTTKDGLSDNTVFYLCLDSHGRLWMYTFSGRIFYFENEKIFPYKYNNLLLLKSINRMPEGFYVDSTGAITVSILERGAIRFDKNGVMTFLDTVLMTTKPHYNIQEFSDGTSVLSITASNPAEKDVFVKHNYSGNVQEYSLRTAESTRFKFIRVNKNKIIFSIGKNIFQVENKVTTKIFSAPLIILSMLVDSKKNLWVGTEDGVYYFEKGNWEAVPKIYLKQNTISSIFQDNENGYWFTTLENGLFYLPDYQIKNIRLEGKYQKPISLASDFLHGVYIGCWTGSILKYENGTIKRIYELTDTTVKLPITDLTTFENDKRIYVSRFYPGYILNNKFNIWKTNIPIGVKSDFIKINSGEIYTSATAFVFKVKGDSLITKYVTSQRINTLAETPGGKLIVGGNHGVFEIDTNNRSEKVYLKKLDEIRIDDIKKLGSKLVFATKGEGLYIQYHDSLYHIDESNGLSSNLTSELTIDKNIVWVATNKGINKIEFKNELSMEYSIQVIRHNDGLLSDAINEIVILNDTVFVATNPGLSMFDAKCDFENQMQPRVYISSVRLNAHEIPFTGKMDFAYDRNNLHVEFNAVSFKSFGNILYRYELMHEKDTLTSTSSNREVEFLSLLPGEYEFKVYAMNASGVWSNEAKGFRFTIHPAWWQTLWFKGFVSLFLALIIFFYYKNQIRKIKRKNEIEKQQASLQLTAIRAQMNPHFIFNVMNSIRIYMQSHDLKSAERYLTSFSKLVRYVLDNSDKQVVSLEDELNALKNYTDLEKQQFENGFDFEIKAEEGIDLSEYQLPSLLLQPFVENSIKHGISKMKSGGKILIDIKRSGDGLLIAIEDNGIGCKEANEQNNLNPELHNSKGTQLIFDRIEAYNRSFGKKINAQIHDLLDENGKSRGTRAEVEI